MDHAAAGAVVAAKWNLPPMLIQTIKHHHGTLASLEPLDAATPSLLRPFPLPESKLKLALHRALNCLAHHAPPFTVASLARIITWRPCTRPIPAITLQSLITPLAA